MSPKSTGGWDSQALTVFVTVEANSCGPTSILCKRVLSRMLMLTQKDDISLFLSLSHCYLSTWSCGHESAAIYEEEH